MIYSSEWPFWLKALVCLAVAVVAVASIWGQFKDSKLLRAVAREILIKEGQEQQVDKAASLPHPPAETVKSQTAKAAEDSKKTVDMLDQFKVEYNTRHMLLEDRVKALEEWRSLRIAALEKEKGDTSG